MRLRFNQLETHLKDRLAPIYLVAGDEPLQTREATDSIRARARARGFIERQVMEVGDGFDWGEFQAACDCLSLFAEQRLIDLRIPSAKPGVVGGKVLSDYAKQPPGDTLLLITTAKLDRSSASSAWFRALDTSGVVLQVWPLSTAEMQGWIAARLRHKGLLADRDAVRFLAARFEGNLLAASQEIEKLSLVHGEGSLDMQAVLSTVADCARFSIFDLVDAVLAGDTGRAVRILNALRAEAVAPPLVLWSLTDQLRVLVTISLLLQRGSKFDLATKNIWKMRRPLIKRALSRLSSRRLYSMLRQCARIDRVIKGIEAGREWEELLQLTLKMCGQDLFRTE